VVGACAGRIGCRAASAGRARAVTRIERDDHLGGGWAGWTSVTTGSGTIRTVLTMPGNIEDTWDCARFG
jgi:hypothetical protein